MLGDGQPKGYLDNESYRCRGWHGASLLKYTVLLNHPLRQEEMASQWLLGRVHAQNALDRARGMQRGASAARPRRKCATS